MKYFLCVGWVLFWLVGCGVNAGQENSLRIETPDATPERTRPYETPTPLADDPEVAELLGSWCDTGCAEAVVDYIGSHPNSPYTDKLIEHLFEIHWSRMPLGDFVRDLITERMVAPLNKNGRVPEDFLGWKVLGEDFDLNGDGVKDLIGVVSRGDEQGAWAFLSEGAVVRALYVRKELPVGALDLRFVVGFPQEWKFERMTVTDADGNGMPEILLEQTGIRWVGRWNRERFVGEGE